MPYLKQIIAVGVLGIVIIVGLVAYSVFKPPAEATAPIEAIPLGTSAAAVVDTPAAAPAAADTPAAVDEATAAPAAATAEAAPTGSVLLRIVQEESEARFSIDEVLNGAPNTVVGATNQVAGEIAIDPRNLANTRVGIIRVNARTFTTDNNFRNRAIQNRILQTDQFEFITFTPTGISGLPEQGAIGEPYTFQIAGDLTIRDVTRPVTFDVTARASSESRIEGTASTTIKYADYGISIPQVRQVASVADEVRLELDFVATTSS